MKAAASATKQGEHRNREKKRNPHFISNFGVCENHRWLSRRGAIDRDQQLADARESAATACRIGVCFLRLCPCRNSITPDRSVLKRAPGIGTDGCSISGLVEHPTPLGARSNDDGVHRGERSKSPLSPEMAAVLLAGDAGCPSRGCRESDPRESTQRSRRRGAANAAR